MKGKLIAGICILFLNSFVFAQNTKVTLNDGTIVEGASSYSGWGENQDEIEVTLGSETVVYSPQEVTEFTLNGDRYITKDIELSYVSKSTDVSINDDGEKIETDNLALESIQKKAFLRVVVLGPASFYTYNDGTTHFFVEKEGKIIELLRLKRSNKPTLNRYVGQLNLLFSDCSKMTNNDKVQFSKDGIKRAVLKYNECISGNSDFVEIKRPLKLSLYLVGGYKLTSYSLSAENYGRKTDGESSSGTPAYGIGFDISGLGRTDRFQIHSEILLQKYEYEATYRNQTSPNQFTDFFVDLDLTYVEIAALLRYNFGDISKDKLGFFVNAGINQGFQFSDDSTEFSNAVFFSSEVTNEREPLNGDIVSARTTFVLGAGLRYKIITGEIRYDFNPRLTGKPTVSNTSNINLLLSAKLF